MRRRQISVVLIAAFIPASTWAAEAQRAPAGWYVRTTSDSATSPAKSPMREGLNLFGQLGAGVNSVSSDEFQNAPFGGNFMAGALASWRATSWVIDTGLGWRYLRSSGVASDGSEISIRTREGFAELSPRYRLTDGWQLGPVLDLAFGTDTSKSATYGPGSATLYGGAKVAYEMPFGAAALRAFAEATQDLSMTDRASRLVMVGLQIGIPVARDRAETVADARPILSSSAAPMVPRELRVELDPAKVFFSTNSQELKPLVARTLRKVGIYLRDHDEEWASLEVSGHADRRGRYEYNLALSRRRAESVLSAMQLSERSDKARLEAYSYSVPLDKANTPQAWAKNRRVELVFEDIADVRAQEELKRLLKPLTASTGSPAGDSP